jgi:hypothetical protein
MRDTIEQLSESADFPSRQFSVRARSVRVTLQWSPNEPASCWPTRVGPTLALIALGVWGWGAKYPETRHQSET